MPRSVKTTAQENLERHLEERGAVQGRLSSTMAARQSDVYRDRNRELFVRRRELTELIAPLVAKDPATLTLREKTALRRYRHEFEVVTTEIVQTNMGLVRGYIKIFSRSATPEDIEDFMNAGVVGLMKAIDSFDPDRGKFAQWAYKPIQREVFHAVRFTDHPNMNQTDWERRGDVQNAIRKISLEQGGSYKPTPEEIVAACDKPISLEQVTRILNAPRLDSLSHPVGDGEGSTLGDLIEDEGYDLEDTVLTGLSTAALEQYGLPVLNARELFVLVRRFGLDGEPRSRLSTVGEQLDLSREAVRQVQEKALAKISHPSVLRKLVRSAQ